VKRHRGIRRTIVALIFLGVAINPALFESLLEVAGLSPPSARLAAARLAVVTAFAGSGLFALGVTAIARQRRLHRAASAIAESLRSIPALHSPRLAVVDNIGAVLNAEIEGVRMEVVVEPLRGGRAWVRAQSPTGNPISVWPKGLAPAEEQAFRTCGDEYECFSERADSKLRELEDDLNQVFGLGEASHVVHDQSGIEVCMPNEPKGSRISRLSAATRLVAGLARVNR